MKGFCIVYLYERIIGEDKSKADEVCRTCYEKRKDRRPKFNRYKESQVVE